MIVVRAVGPDRLFGDARRTGEGNHGARGERRQRFVEKGFQAGADAKHDVGGGEGPGVGRA